MKKTTTLFLFLTFNLLYSNLVQAAVFKAIANGAWEANYVWDQGTVPGIGDIVIIDGFLVTLSTSVTIAELTLTNANGPSQGELVISSITPITATITGNLNLEAENRPLDVELHLKGEADLVVDGNVYLTRANNNVQSTNLQLYLYGNSETYINGNLDFLYNNSGDGESGKDILLDDNAILTVNGTTSLILDGGKSLQMLAIDSSTINLDSLVIQGNAGKEVLVQSVNISEINISSDVVVKNAGASEKVKLGTGYDGGTISIDKSLKIISTGNNLKTIVETNGPTSSMEVKGDISLLAEGDSTVYLIILNQSPLYLGGDIVRATEYGNFISKDGGELVLNGSSQQSIPGSTPSAGTNLDHFSIGNVTFSNTSGLPIILEDDLLFTGTLNLTNGNIVSSNDAMIIIGPTAKIQGASEHAYIEGPMKKIGSTSGENFDFPIGNATTYAPMRISPVSTAGSEYIARYDGDPPPFGENKALGVEQVTGNQSWSIEPAVGSDSVAVTLYWDDATAMGVELENELIVVSLDETNFWNSKGNTDVSLTSPGHVTSIKLGDPPPFGEHQLTMGLAPEGSLPVELAKFGAVQQKDKVYLEWYTSSEIDASHFELERSSDKVNFNMIHTVNSSGAEELSMKYSALDNTPSQGLNYYRLKMVDQDGSFEYSHIEVVEYEAAVEIMIYPNPVLDMLQVQGEKEFGTKTFEVYDRNGLLLHQRFITFEDGKFEISVDEINVSIPGTYFMRITDVTGSKVVKFLKVK